MAVRTAAEGALEKIDVTQVARRAGNRNAQGEGADMRYIASKLGVCVWLCFIVAVRSAEGAPEGLPENPPTDAPADVLEAIKALYSDDHGTRARSARVDRDGASRRAGGALPYPIQQQLPRPALPGRARCADGDRQGGCPRSG